MADEKIEISREAREWVEELENMKKINFFPYLKADSFGGAEEAIEPKKENCASENHCGLC